MSRPPRELASELSKLLKKMQSLRNDQITEVENVSRLEKSLKLTDSPEWEDWWQELKETLCKIYDSTVQEYEQTNAIVEKIKEIVHKRRNKHKKRKCEGESVLSPAASAVAEMNKRPKPKPQLSGDELRLMGEWWHHDDMILEERIQVAALSDHKAKLWILARVRRYDCGGGRDDMARYEVIDDEDNDGNENKNRKIYLLHPSKIIPLPSLQTVPLGKRKVFQRGETVYAVFPESTVLYPCVVSAKPTKKTKDMYAVTFDDDDEKVRHIPANWVAPLIHVQ